MTPQKSLQGSIETVSSQKQRNISKEIEAETNKLSELLGRSQKAKELKKQITEFKEMKELQEMAFVMQKRNTPEKQ